MSSGAAVATVNAEEKMDPDSPVSRVERTFWTVWNYISEAVSRFLRPEPPIIERNDENTDTQDASVTHELLDSGHTNQTTKEEVSFLSPSRSVVSWDTGSEPETQNMQEHISRDEEDKTHKEGEGMREEQVDETGIDVANLSITENETEVKQEESIHLQLYAEVIPKTPEDTDSGSLNLPDEALNEDADETKQIICSVEETDITIIPHEQQNVDQMKEMDKEDLNQLHTSFFYDSKDTITCLQQTELSKGLIEKIQVQSEEKSSLTLPEKLSNVKFKMTNDICSIVPEGEQIVAKEHIMAVRNDDFAKDETEDDMKNMPGSQMDPTRQGPNIFEEDDTQLDGDNRDITKHITCDTTAVAEEGEQHDAKDLSLGTMTKKLSLNTEVFLDDEGISEINDHTDELQSLSTEGESCMENLCFSVTVKHEVGSEQEEAKAFKNIPPRDCEGQDSVSQELYSTYKESQEGVPEHNNEAGSPGSATQRFLEVGNYRKVQTTLLQEEVESGEANLQNSSGEAGPDSLTVTEHMETETPENSFVVDNTGSLTERKTTLTELEIEKPGHDIFMKTEAEYKLFEADFVSQDETEEEREDSNEDTKELLVEFEMGKGLSDVEAACDGREMEGTGIDGIGNVAGFTEGSLKCFETEFQKMNEIILVHQSTDENVFCTSSQTKSKETEAESLVEIQYTGLDLKDMENDLCILEEKTDGQTISNTEIFEMHLGIAAIDAQTVPGTDESLDMSEYEMSTSKESAEESIKESAEESIKGVYEGKDVQYMLAQEPEPQCNDVIEDDILDLWIQQTSLENADMKQQGDLAQDEMLPVHPEERERESMSGELGFEGDVNLSSSTAESGFLDQSLLDMWDSHKKSKKEEHESPKIEHLTDQGCELSNISESEDASEFSQTKEDSLSRHLSQGLDISPESTDDDAQTRNTDAEVSMSSQVMKHNSKSAVETDEEPMKKMRTLYKFKAMVQSTSSDEIKNTMLTYDTQAECQEEEQRSEEELYPGLKRNEDKDISEVDASELDFVAQKSRIAVKNPRVRPPKDPRALLQKPSLEPSPSKQLPTNIPAGVPVGGLGFGIKLPGLGGGFPVLKKTKKTVQEEHTPETSSQEVKPEDKQVDSQHRPKWMPPKHPGFGNPLMSELKTKLKKTAKE